MPAGFWNLPNKALGLRSRAGSSPLGYYSLAFCCLALILFALGGCGDRAVTKDGEAQSASLSTNQQLIGASAESGGKLKQTVKKSKKEPKSSVKKTKQKPGEAKQAKASALSPPAKDVAQGSVSPERLASSPAVDSDQVISPELPSQAEVATKGQQDGPDVNTSIPSENISSEKPSAELVLVPTRQVQLITGLVRADYPSRHPGADLSKVRDRYDVDLQIANMVSIQGNIQRSPRIVGGILGREKQPLQYQYALAFRGVGAKPGLLGQWEGQVVVGLDGVYRFQGNGGQGLRIAGSESGKTDIFSGTISGKAPETKGIASLARKYSNWRGKDLSQSRKKNIRERLVVTDLKIGSGPDSEWSAAAVNGSLEFDQDTATWSVTELDFVYLQSSQVLHDKLSGSIRLEPELDKPGRGSFVFNLKFAGRAGTENESQFFDKTADESEFFAENSSDAQIIGSIGYSDNLAKLGDPGSEKEIVVSSELVYKVEAVNLNTAQVINFLKFWLLVIGPVNDN